MSPDDFIVQEKTDVLRYRWQSYNELVEYKGDETDVVIPENVDVIDKNAFKNKHITSLVLSPEIPIEEFWSVNQMNELTYLKCQCSFGTNCNLQAIQRKCPALQVIEFANAAQITFYGNRKASSDLVIKVMDSDMKSIRCGGRWVDDPSTEHLELFAPYISPGKVEFPFRYVLIQTFMRHRDWYPKDSAEAYEKWLQKNAGTFLPKCLENEKEDLVLTFLDQLFLRLPAKAYDAIIEGATAHGFTEIQAKALELKNRYHDMRKLAQRAETIAMNDMEDPLRRHAMKQIWSWSDQEDGSAVLKKFKGEPSEIIQDGILRIPEKVGKQPVSGVMSALVDQSQLRGIHFPKGVHDIAISLYQGLRKLEEVVFEGTVEGIPFASFFGCPKLKRVVFKQNSVVISERAVVEPFDLPPAYPPFVISPHAFENCPGIRMLNGTSILLGQEAFASSGLRTICLHHTHVIPWGCFRSCRNLNEVDLQDVRVIETRAFFGCGNLTTLHFSDALCFVAGTAFDACKIVTVHFHHVKDVNRLKRILKDALGSRYRAVIHED